MADLQTVKIRDLIETQQVMTTDYMVLEKDTGTFKCQARYLKGATGLTPNVQVGNTTTLAPGQLATVTQRGNTENPVFDFGIPQGVQGQIGPQGPKGDTPDITPLQTQIDNRFNALTSQQQGSSEVIDARGGYPALKARLDAINDDLIKYNDQTIVTHTTESNFSSIDATKNGYLDNILLEGKTLVVDSNNQVVLPGTQGAMLKSVGDDVNEIKLNSMNYNLWSKYNVYYGDLDSTNGTQRPIANGIVTTNELIPVIYGSLYAKAYDKDGLNSNYSFYCYGLNKEFLGIVTGTGSYTAVLKNGTKYVRARITKPNFSPIDKDSLKVYIGYSVKNSFDVNKTNTKKVLYKDTDNTWKKTTLRQWDSIEKHSDGKYYYHKRSGLSVINNNTDFRLIKQSGYSHTQFWNDQSTRFPGIKKPGGKNVNNYVSKISSTTNLDEEFSLVGTQAFVISLSDSKASSLEEFNTLVSNENLEVVYELQDEQVFECTPLDLISYDSQTNYSVECGPIYPKTTLKVNSYLGNVVSILKDKVSYLENMLVDGLKLVVSGNMQELAYRLYPQDFVDNLDDSVDMEVIE